MNEPSSAQLQHNALQLYLALRLHRDTWAGSLLLGIGLDEAGCALALASLAAGAAALFLEHEPANLRSAQRDGCCTFTVTTLPEAVRVLKNEVRLGHAITVALRSPADEALQEVVRRGVQPAAFAFSRTPSVKEEPLAATLRSRGADNLGGFGLSNTLDAIDLQAPVRAALSDRWMVDTHHAATRVERAQHDRTLLAEAPTLNGETDPIASLASHWLRAAPSLFPRALSRVVLRRVT